MENNKIDNNSVPDSEQVIKYTYIINRQDK